MQDEEMDDIIRDASNQHYPAYDDQAWGKMERLLDKHLPQKENKRKYLLLLFLLIGSGVFVVFLHLTKPNSAQQEVITKNINQNLSGIVPGVNNQGQGVTVNNSQKNNIQETSSTTIKTTVPLNNPSITIAINNNSNEPQNPLQKTSKTIISKNAKFKSHIGNPGAFDIVDTKDNAQTGDIKDESPIDNKTTQPIKTNTPKGPGDIIKPTDSSTEIKLFERIVTNKKDTLVNTKPITASVPKQENKKKNTFNNNFAFTLSAGPGVSYIGVNNFGTTTFSYGVGIRYRFTKRLAVRTGFYITKKIYSAAPSDYHPPKSFWVYYPNLQKVDANCKVYEIPLSISYDFGQVKNHNWFAAVGLSSYLMKQEIYNYYSKDYSGQTTSSNATIDNKNKNIFSVLTLSGGYQYNINKRVSIVAEPYIELPLNGVGFGNIKLNSGGLLFTAIIKPFAGNH